MSKIDMLKENGCDARIGVEGKLGDDFDLTARLMKDTFDIFMHLKGDRNNG